MTDSECGRQIFRCEDDFTAMMTAVYDAWKWSGGKKHDLVRLELPCECNYELFANYVTVEADEEKCNKVVRSIRNKLSEEIFGEVFKASLSERADKADAIYHFLVVAFRDGKRVLTEFGNSDVMRLFEIVRFVNNEAHFMREFIRFAELEGNVLFAKINPKNDIITLVAPHFADRMPSENWIIYDERRRRAVLHAGNAGWYVTDDSLIAERLSYAEREKGYQDLWKIFFDTIAIKERINYRLQRQMMPLRYRENVVEFNKQF